MAEMEGIEPSYADLESAVLPLNYISKMAGREGFEPSHTEPESAVLPLDNIPLK